MQELLEKGLVGILGYGEDQTILFLTGLVCAVICYLIGSINFAVIVSRRMYADDVRNHGSGNAGSTNMLRTFGAKAGALTFCGDFLKSVFATVLGLVAMPFYTGFAFVAGLACLIGHAWPVFFGFRGGKCVASLAGVVLVLNPPAWILLFLVFVIVVAIWRYVSVASMVGALLIPIFNILMPFWFVPQPPIATVCTLLMAVLVCFLHRKNIVRLYHGEESKLSFGKKHE